MGNKLENFAIRILLDKKGDPLEHVSLDDFRQELSMRNHINKYLVLFKKNHTLEFQIETTGLDLDLTAQQIADEILGIACAVVQDVEGLNVTIISAILLPRSAKGS
jgi:hypothetical protein